MEKNFKKTYRSDVKKGVWHGRYVVIKKLQKQVASTLEIKILKEEISQIRILSHKNLELIIAACLTLPHLSILTEFEANGNLFDLLRSPSWELGPSTAILIAIGICDGMIYLEEQRAHHYNLKSKNVLITADNIPKLADYGFKDSIFASYPKLTAADQSVYASQIQLDKQTGKIEVKYPPSLLYDVPWVAPEILLAMSADSNLEVDFSCADVYSYGVVFFEIVTRSEPYEEMNNMRIGYLVSNLNVRPEVPDFVPDNLVSSF